MQTYEVQMRRESAQQVIARTRDLSLTLGAKRGDLEAGFNPVETLLSALGACLLTALQMVAELSRVPVTGMAIHLTGVRQDQPPQLVSVTYQLTIHTDAAEERLRRLVATAQRNSTVYQTLALAIPVSGTVVRIDEAATI
ncbi:MAG: OsmC family protein [Thermaerobacter sp.]|nr:OsmC family protein [Thermaerobacter sp.]